MSLQLEGVQKQLANIETGTGSLITQGNQQVDLLQQIANSLAGQGTGTSGAGTGDVDSNGTDDFFGDTECLSPPPCDGPAIECAIAIQAYSTRCNLQDSTEDITETDIQTTLGDTQTIEQYFDSADPNNIIDITGSFIAPAESTSGCPGDYAIGTRFGSFNISYSYMCDFGNTVRPIVLLAAWIISGLMFYGALLRDW